MNSFVTSILLPLFVAAAGTLIAPWLFDVPAKRRARGEAREALAQVEYLRVPDADRTRKDFEQAVSRWEALALVARVPQPIVEDYVLLARSGRFVGEETISEPVADPRTGKEYTEAVWERGHVPCIKKAAKLASDTLWNPWRSRFGRTKQRREIQSRMEQLRRSPEITGAILGGLLDHREG